MAEEDLNIVENEDQLIDSIDKKVILENGHQEDIDFSDPEDFVDPITDEGLYRLFICRLFVGLTIALLFYSYQLNVYLFIFIQYFG
jgi:hypothetical protein